MQEALKEKFRHMGLLAEAGESMVGWWPPPTLSSGSRSQSSDAPVPMLCWVALGFAADSRSHAHPAQTSWWVPFTREDLAGQHKKNDCFLLLQGTGWEVGVGLGQWGGDSGS